MNRPDLVSNAFLETVLDIWGERGEEVACVLEGNCMAPWIRDGDELVIRPGARDLHSGDVVLVRSSRGRLVERIVRVRCQGGRATYVIKPDRRYELRPLLGTEDILGKVVAVRGQRGVCFLDTIRWRVLNRVLAWRSYASGRCWQPDTRFWKAAAAVAAAWRKARRPWTSSSPPQGGDGVRTGEGP